MRYYGTEYSPDVLARLARLGDWETASSLYDLWDGDRLDTALAIFAPVADQTGADMDEWWRAAQTAADTHGPRALDAGLAVITDAHPNVTLFADIGVDETLWLIDHTLDAERLQYVIDGTLDAIKDAERREDTHRLFLHRMERRARLMRDAGIA